MSHDYDDPTIEALWRVVMTLDVMWNWIPLSAQVMLEPVMNTARPLLADVAEDDAGHAENFTERLGPENSATVISRERTCPDCGAEYRGTHTCYRADDDTRIVPRRPDVCRHCRDCEAEPRLETVGEYRNKVVHDYERGPTVLCELNEVVADDDVTEDVLVETPDFHTCPTCGGGVEVVTSDEGTSFFKPVVPSAVPDTYQHKFEETEQAFLEACEDVRALRSIVRETRHILGHNKRVSCNCNACTTFDRTEKYENRPPSGVSQETDA